MSLFFSVRYFSLFRTLGWAGFNAVRVVKETAKNGANFYEVLFRLDLTFDRSLLIRPICKKAKIWNIRESRKSIFLGQGKLEFYKMGLVY